jgi:hypothetical protein
VVLPPLLPLPLLLLAIATVAVAAVAVTAVAVAFIITVTSVPYGQTVTLPIELVKTNTFYK